MAVRQVSPGGSINAAIDMSAPGDTVEVRGGGTHTGGIRVAKPGVTVIGENPDVRVGGQLYATTAGADSRVTGLYLFNGANTARVNPAIEAHRFRLDHCTVDNEHKSIAIHIGAGGVQTADAVVEHNLIIHVGRMPWTNYDHGIYFRNTLRAIARHNVFEDGGDYALHFWGPSVGTLIEYNLVRGGWAGAVILGGYSATDCSRGTRIRRNIFLGPPRSGRSVVYEYWEGMPGDPDNRVEDNIVRGGTRFPSPPRGFIEAGNLDIDPQIVDGLITNQAALGYGPASIQPGGEPPPPPPPPPPNIPDTTPPTLTWVRPAEGAVLTGSFLYTAEAADASGIEWVEFRLKDLSRGIDQLLFRELSAPYGETPFDTTALPDGPYTLTATARDRAGNESTITRQVTVENVPEPDPDPDPDPDPVDYQALYNAERLAHEATVADLNAVTAERDLMQGRLDQANATLARVRANVAATVQRHVSDISTDLEG